MEKHLEKLKLRELGIDPKAIEGAKTTISISTLVISDSGDQKSSSKLNTVLGFASGGLIYIFIFIYGSMVMRGVIEEKSSRIVEVIISSVKPFQLMLGKIIGVAATGLTQFLLWIILTFVIISVAQATIIPAEFDPSAIGTGAEVAAYGGNADIAAFMEALATINFPLVIGCFIFFFLGGYLLYSSLFAAIGSAVDNESDSQQFMMPVTVPLILSFVIGTKVAENPDGPIAFWFSLIPLTSPIVMMVRIPFGVPTWELVLSMILLIAGFLGTTWLASRIYRVGILMYGKKVSWGELIKWMRYKA
jgi:ABC-2 type transport system permease protein